MERSGLSRTSVTPTFLLVHGFGASRFSWRHWVPELEGRGHVIQVDLKGFGAADHPSDDEYGLHDHAALVLELVRHQELEQLTVVGHSMGGSLALLAALTLTREDPGRLRRLVIVSGAAYPQQLPPFVSLARWPRTFRLALRLVDTRRLGRFVLRSIVHDPATVTDDQVEGYAAPLGSADARRTLLATASRIVPDDVPRIVERFGEIDVPTLLLWGEEDRVVPPSLGRRLHRALPRSTWSSLDGCGHLPAEERPEQSLALLLRFLDDHPP